MGQVRLEEKPCYYSKPKFFRMKKKNHPGEYFMRCVDHENGPCSSPSGTIAVVSETRDGKVRHTCLRCCGRKD